MPRNSIAETVIRSKRKVVLQMSDKGHFGKVNDQYTGYIYVTTNEINKKWYIGSCWCKNMAFNSCSNLN